MKLVIPCIIAFIIACLAAFGIYELYLYAVNCIPLNEWFKLIQIGISILFVIGGIIAVYNIFLLSFGIMILFFN